MRRLCYQNQFLFILKLELITITKTSHLDSLWKRDWGELGNGLLKCQTAILPRRHCVLEEMFVYTCYWLHPKSTTHKSGKLILCICNITTKDHRKADIVGKKFTQQTILANDLLAIRNALSFYVPSPCIRRVPIFLFVPLLLHLYCTMQRDWRWEST